MAYCMYTYFKVSNNSTVEINLSWYSYVFGSLVKSIKGLVDVDFADIYTYCTCQKILSYDQLKDIWQLLLLGFMTCFGSKYKVCELEELMVGLSNLPKSFYTTQLRALTMWIQKLRVAYILQIVEELVNEQ